MPNFELCTGYTKIKLCLDLEGQPKKYKSENFRAHVNGALAELATKPIGSEFLTKLEQKLIKQNNQIIIYYSVKRGNQCEGGNDQFTAMRQAMMNDNPKMIATELCHALIGKVIPVKDIDIKSEDFAAPVASLAAALYRNPVPTWDPSSQPENSMNLASADAYIPHIEKWLKATAPIANKNTSNTMLAFLYSRELSRKDKKSRGEGGDGRHLRRGMGCSSKVFWLPEDQGPSQFRRPPVIGLAHELCHAYYNNLGDQIGTEGGNFPDNALYEIMATGLGPYFQAADPNGNNGWKYCENTFRAAFRIPPRMKYE